MKPHMTRSPVTRVQELNEVRREIFRDVREGRSTVRGGIARIQEINREKAELLQAR